MAAGIPSTFVSAVVAIASDPFELLGLPVSYELNQAVLETRHRELSRALHPDRYVGRPASERRQALGRAIEVNEAFRSLRDPVRRAELLLTRLGVSLGERVEREVGPELLMEIMELRETLAELRRAGDANGVEKLCQRVEQRRAEATRKLEAGFRAALEPGAAPNVNALQKELLPIVVELRYYARFQSEAHAILDDLP